MSDPDSHNLNEQPPSTSAQPPPAPAQHTPDKSTFRYIRPPSATHPPRPADLPDTYFEPTALELRAQQASLSARTHALQNAPLRTSAMRDAEDKKRKARWPQTTIRVKFADQTMLEKSFPSTDKIKAVYAFVRGLLHEDVKPIKFVLYQTPPKREYKVSDPNVRDLSLADLSLAPSSMLMLKFDDDSFNHQDVPAPLASPVLALLEDYPIPPDFGVEAKPPAANDTNAPSSNKSKSIFPFDKKENKNNDDEGSGSGERKLPKWLKLGPK